MRVVIQRVSFSEVTINQKEKANIEKGLLVLLGLETEDTEDDIPWLAAKIAQLRIFADEAGLMNKSVKDIRGEIMVISQFTLHASTKKGNRPSFIKAARPEQAVPLYEKFCRQLSAEMGKEVKTGEFGADMQVHLNNDGPVTIIIDTKNKE